MRGDGKKNQENSHRWLVLSRVGKGIGQRCGEGRSSRNDVLIRSPETTIPLVKTGNETTGEADKSPKSALAFLGMVAERMAVKGRDRRETRNCKLCSVEELNERLDCKSMEIKRNIYIKVEP